VQSFSPILTPPRDLKRWEASHECKQLTRALERADDQDSAKE
jgi:hypothetical protein